MDSSGTRGHAGTSGTLAPFWFWDLSWFERCHGVIARLLLQDFTLKTATLEGFPEMHGGTLQGCSVLHLSMKNNSQKIIPPEVLLDAYAQGIFPMSESREDDGVGWYSANVRGVIPLDNFRVSKNVRRIIQQERFECRVNSCFRRVLEECANRETTWISDLIINSYEVLHLAGHAHSVEMFNDDGKLTGGLYGVSLGAAFFGESMFKNENEADKVALWHCHHILQKNGFRLWDTQFYTEHLARFGCIQMPPDEYRKRLEEALRREAEFKQ